MKKGRSLFRIIFPIILLILGLKPSLGFEVGALLGPTFNRFSSPDLSWNYRISYSGGGYVNIQISRFFQLQPELRFTTARSNAVISINYFSYSQEVNLNKTIQYIELPLTLHFIPFNWSKIRPNLQLGGYGAVLVHGEDYLESRGQSHTEDIHDELKRFHYGLLIGAGIDFNISRIPFHLSFLWRIALNPLAANDLLQQEIESTGFVINLGFGIWNSGGRAH
jgi:hypothetical protein